MRVQIIKAEQDDLAEILALQHLAYQSEAALLGTKDIPPLTQNLDDIIAEFQFLTFFKALDQEGRIVASVRGQVIEETLHIGKLMVHPSLRGRGIGSQLLRAIESSFACKRFELFTSAKSLDNLRLYQRLGYTVFKKKQLSPELLLLYLQRLAEQPDNPAK